MIYWLCLFFLCWPTLYANETVISAISSLKCYLEQKQDSSELDIPFEEEDIALLWEKASLSGNQKILNLRDRFEANSNDELLENDLNEVWDNLKNSFNYNKNTAKDYSQYLIPSNHPLAPALDAIFYSSRATANMQTMFAAGFSKVSFQHSSFMCVAWHPGLPGFLLKLYLDSETRVKEGLPGYVWLTQRCHGAREIRKLIQKKGIKYFTVPDKFLYQLPEEPAPILPPGVEGQPVLLVATDMDIASSQETLDAWKNKITTKHLDELYVILSHGYGSAYVGPNVPLTKSGLFAFIDTEYPKRKIKYHQVKTFLSEPMSRYWDELVRKGGK